MKAHAVIFQGGMGLSGSLSRRKAISEGSYRASWMEPLSKTRYRPLHRMSKCSMGIRVMIWCRKVAGRGDCVILLTRCRVCALVLELVSALGTGMSRVRAVGFATAFKEFPHILQDIGSKFIEHLYAIGAAMCVFGEFHFL